MMMAFTVGAFAQGATTQSAASATIVGPIAIAHVSDMVFGDVAVSATVAGTVVLSPAGARTPTAGVTLPSTATPFSAASFTVTGTSGYTYTIALPVSITLTGTGPAMTVNAFTSTPTPTGTLTGGTETLNVGATLNVAAGQTAGAYSNAAFDVTVNYN